MFPERWVVDWCTLANAAAGDWCLLSDGLAVDNSSTAHREHHALDSTPCTLTTAHLVDQV